jgi:hypothetical protein
MDSLLNVRLILVVGLNTLFYSFLFIVGFAVGVIVMRRLYKRAVPPGYESLDTAIKFLEDELTRIDDVVSQLWAKANLPEQRRNAATSQDAAHPGTDRSWKESFKRFFGINTNTKENEEIHPLVLRLISIKRKLGRLKRNIGDAATCLSPIKPNSEYPGEDHLVNKEGGAIAATASDKQAEQLGAALFASGSSAVIPTPETGDPSLYYPYSSPKAEDRDLNQQTTGRFPATNITAELIESYNRAVTDAFAREQFREMYQPLRVGTVNAVERTRNPTIDAEFRETTDGDFFAIHTLGKNEYSVVPRLGLTIEFVSYNAGALGQVFNNPTYEPGLFYSHYHVRQPAIFKRDGDRWELLSAGELDLGQGD